MVSIRRRKLLGLCAGKTATSVQLSTSSENAVSVESESLNQNVKSVLVHPLPSFDSNEEKQVDISEAYPGSFDASGSSALKEEPEVQQFPVPGVKRRKRHRRKHVEDQEPCTMRGVYFKNMKWQAAIKVDKKQIHLGTVGSQEEAAHLYDRAAFMCGREPNFELSEEEKQELRQFKWEEFLEMTRNAITSKKHQRRVGSGPRRKAGTQARSDWELEQDVRATSASDDMDGDGSVL
uniref:Ethylene-responsive transcription factor-like protein At4g13040 n=1 Tax=Anthurium amnicola TaxID=1678845 RepID=A0A1D1YB75_9ARAE